MITTARVVRPFEPRRATAIGGAVIAAAIVATAGDNGGIVICPFRRCTGGYCPGCGVSRAANRLVRGDVAGSWTQHPWVVLAALQLVVLGGVGLLVEPGRRRRLAVALLLANVLLMLGIWVMRLSTGAIPVSWS